MHDGGFGDGHGPQLANPIWGRAEVALGARAQRAGPVDPATAAPSTGCDAHQKIGAFPSKPGARVPPGPHALTRARPRCRDQGPAPSTFPARSSRAGMRMVKTAPWPGPGTGAATTLPPWAATIAATMDKPRPAPPLARDRDGSARKNRSKTRAASSAPIPGPSSVTWQTHLLAGPGDGNGCGRTGWRVSPDVRQQVVEHLPEPAGVPGDEHRAACLDVELPLGTHGSGRLYRLRRHRHEIDGGSARRDGFRPVGPVTADLRPDAPYAPSRPESRS